MNQRAKSSETKLRIVVIKQIAEIIFYLEKFLDNIITNKSEYDEKKNNLEKHNFQNSWNDINQKILETINEN